MNWDFVLFPLVGAVIGALTNQIAVKMLFRPYTEIRVRGFRLPFTPGVIPAQRERIARNIAETFEQNLMSGDDIRHILTDTRARRVLEAKVDELVLKLGPFAGLASGLKPRIVERLLAALEEIGTQAVGDGGALNIGERIQERLLAMDIRRLESLILDVSGSQLRHITLFGGILGAVIGLVQATLSLWG
jgi:uncharacterized membrane protein YheB (UPF0754 family)